MKNENRKNFDKLISDKQSGWLEDALWREENQDWLKKSAMIAIRILREIRKQKPINGMSQKKLADEMRVTPQYVNKIVKGQENLSLQTISKIENVLGIKITEILPKSESQFIDYEHGKLEVAYSKYQKAGGTEASLTEVQYATVQEPESNYLTA